MPLLHRLACLRDDVVFLVYLYQKWIYPEDKRRRNEFGQVGEAGAEGDDDDEEEEDGKLLQEKEDVTKAKETLLVKESKEDVDDAPRERRTRGSPEGSSKESPEESANKKDL